MSARDVLEWQETLQAAGFPPGDIDGVFGPDTLTASMASIKDQLAATPPVVEGYPPGYLSEHFTAWEFCCKHCGTLPADGIAPELILLLEDVRAQFGQPVMINSGYRCPTHNANVGGVVDSQHVDGEAADFVVGETSPAKVYAYLDPWHDGGLGKYDTFTHVDVRGHRSRWEG